MAWKELVGSNNNYNQILNRSKDLVGLIRPRREGERMTQGTQEKAAGAAGGTVGTGVGLGVALVWYRPPARRLGYPDAESCRDW